MLLEFKTLKKSFFDFVAFGESCHFLQNTRKMNSNPYIFLEW